ncbi:hypothetical protein H5410_028666 [Solanum commersonii]|uniref:Uncharacterized protein n=1 Tax=Solanum commersonii TaxID=4109 RepID=A0A9J5Z879_SOLCO|nr:hypothetical protein H5410_028666 [Solanum commersonii]
MTSFFDQSKAGHRIGLYRYRFDTIPGSAKAEKPAAPCPLPPAPAPAPADLSHPQSPVPSPQSPLANGKLSS